jgi:hypothetical protein
MKPECGLQSGRQPTVEFEGASCRSSVAVGVVSRWWQQGQPTFSTRLATNAAPLLTVDPPLLLLGRPASCETRVGDKW